MKKTAGTQLATLTLGGARAEVVVPIVKRDIRGKARKPNAKEKVTPERQAG